MMDFDLFIKEGAIASIDSERLLVGYGKSTWVSKPSAARAFYFPDFFLEDQKPWLQFEHTNIISRDDIVLHQNALPPCKFSAVGATEFLSVKHHFSDKNLKKMVPYIFYQTSERKELCHMLQKVLGKRALHPFGHWNESGGRLGGTPELLCRIKGDVVETMAVAGTAKDQDALLSDKIKREHQIVIDGIKESLEPFGTVMLNKTEPRPFGPLYHLVTPIALKLENPRGVEEIVRALHPTAALGGYPKQESLKVLRKYNQQMPRGRFGAPAGAIVDNSAAIWIAIRGVEWNSSGMKVPIGCGILPESDMNEELRECELKFCQTKDALNL